MEKATMHYSWHWLKVEKLRFKALWAWIFLNGIHCLHIKNVAQLCRPREWFICPKWSLKCRFLLYNVFHFYHKNIVKVWTLKIFDCKITLLYVVCSYYYSWLLCLLSKDVINLWRQTATFVFEFEFNPCRYRCSSSVHFALTITPLVTFF